MVSSILITIGLFSAEPFPEAILPYCKLDISEKRQRNLNKTFFDQIAF